MHENSKILGSADLRIGPRLNKKNKNLNKKPKASPPSKKIPNLKQKPTVGFKQNNGGFKNNQVEASQKTK